MVSFWAIEVEPLQRQELTVAILQAKSQTADEGLRWIHRLHVARVSHQPWIFQVEFLDFATHCLESTSVFDEIQEHGRPGIVRHPDIIVDFAMIRILGSIQFGRDTRLIQNRI